ncbi:AAA family ATPase [Sphingobacteriaceae bacterium WQ 2009]|uniref:AAA family ATPase n=1 Tax=Rhinopithecimicrobium faecis TaxID=2820698 RepID=A0A8T4HBI6_9SPHI|nr:AAA family ATPase [Sphingobacteriaceae bacterium WQ 2009]
MAAYFLNDTFMCSELGINLKKGILLAGPIGCGKTFLFELIRTILDYENQFKIKSCRSIVSEYAENGPLVIRQYTRGHIYHQKPFVFCFDDLGAEMNTNYYGTEINVLGEILLTRYDVFVREGVKTHITTNLSTHEIDVIYGNRARSRFREMFLKQKESPKRGL